MRSAAKALFCALCCLVFCVSVHAGAELKDGELKLPLLHPLFGDNAVLQSGAKLPVWGWADAGAKVRLELFDAAGKAVASRDAVAGKDGRWQVELGPLEPGGPYALGVAAGKASAKAGNILAGEVWLCSGQSNMYWPLLNIGPTGKDEVEKASWPQVRMFNIASQLSIKPELSYRNASWLVCTPANAKIFSAVGYFFGRELHQALKCPVGLINASWGGTRAEAWMSRDALAALPYQNKLLDEFQTAARESRNPKHAEEYEAKLAKWFQDNDPGSSASPSWADPAADLSSWQKISVPSGSDLKVPNGVLWIRRSFTLPAAWAGKDLDLMLGCSDLDDWETVFLNGTQVGVRYNREMKNSYRLPASLLKEGENVIARRIVGFKHTGFKGKAEHLWVNAKGAPGGQSVQLAGEWHYRAGVESSKYKGVLPADDKPHQNSPAVLYNGMIAPLLQFSFKGCIWYQGEANSTPGDGVKYLPLLKALIADWRKGSGSEFPFGVVQLPNFNPPSKVPVEDRGWNGSWVDVRDAQFQASKELPKTGCVATIDLGDPGNIHPSRKLEVGQRLSLWALNQVYGKATEFSGPVFESMKVEGSSVRVSFSHLGGGLVSSDGEPLRWFALAGADGKFVFAQAKIDGDSVLVSSQEIASPVAVRYAWVQNPEKANFYSKAGLPAVPFKASK